MDTVPVQFERWLGASAGMDAIFSRARVFNLQELASRIFEYNLKVYAPLVVRAACRPHPQPELAANLIAVVVSQLGEGASGVIEGIIFSARSQLAGFGGDFSSAQPFLVSAHLLALKALDAWPVFQLLVCLCSDKKFKVARDMMAVCSAQLRESSAKSYEYIKAKIGECKASSTLDIVLDEHKSPLKCDVDKVGPLDTRFRLAKSLDDWDEVRVAILGEESESESEEDGEEGEEEAAPAPTHAPSAAPAAIPVAAPAAAPARAAPAPAPAPTAPNPRTIALQKTIYLTIMSSISTREACHKLAAIGDRPLVIKMLLESCKQEKIYNKNFAQIASALACIGKEWKRELEASFAAQYVASEAQSTKEIRHLGTLFGWLLATHSLTWDILECSRLTPEDSTPSTRIFLQSVFEEMRREAGLGEMRKMQKYKGLFPEDAKGLRFSINFFTAIKMGPLTDEMRERLKKV